MRRQAHTQRFECNFLLQFLECSFIHTNAAQIETQSDILGVAIGIDFCRLEYVDMEWSRLWLHDLARSLIASGEAVAFVERLRDHDLVVAVHKVQRRRFLQRNSEPQLDL